MQLDFKKKILPQHFENIALLYLLLLFPLSIVHFNNSFCSTPGPITLPLILTGISQSRQSNMNLFRGDLTLLFGLILV